MGSIDSKWSGGYWWFTFLGTSPSFFSNQGFLYRITCSSFLRSSPFSIICLSQHPPLQKKTSIYWTKKTCHTAPQRAPILGCGCFRLQIMLNQSQPWKLTNLPYKTVVGNTIILSSWVLAPFLGLPIPSFWKVVCSSGASSKSRHGHWPVVNLRFLFKTKNRLEMGKKWVFPKIGVPPKWMVYNGKSYWNGWFGGTTIFGNIQIYLNLVVCNHRFSMFLHTGVWIGFEYLFVCTRKIIILHLPIKKPPGVFMMSYLHGCWCWLIQLLTFWIYGAASSSG